MLFDIGIFTQFLALSASFRGRGLKGCVLNIPTGYSGFVMKEGRRSITDEEVSIKNEAALHFSVLDAKR